MGNSRFQLKGNAASLGRWARAGLALFALLASSAEAKPKRHHHVVRKSHLVAAGQTTATPVAHTATRAAVLHSGAAVTAKVSLARRRRSRHVFYNPWTEPTYADSTVGDSTDGEDLVVRKAAVDALGPYNGAVVVSDATTGTDPERCQPEISSQGRLPALFDGEGDGFARFSERGLGRA